MKVDWNDNWFFYKKGSTEKKKIKLPHDAMLYEKREPKCVNGQNTGYFPGGYYIYEKEFELSEMQLENYIAVLFEGVYRNASVYCNGELLTFHAYGYTEFEVELKNVKAGKNHLRVEVDNTKEPNSRWYTGSGIYRPVSLIIKDRAYIRDVHIVTKSIEPPVVEITCSDMAAKVRIVDEKILHENVADRRTADVVDAVEEVDTENAKNRENVLYQGTCGEICLDEAKLWSAEHPKLYKAILETKTDRVETLFGIRSLEWSAEKGFLVNGVATKLRGGCIHHDNGLLGACAFKDAEYRKVRILKEAGYNAIRSAHNPCSRYLLEACDELGMYVMDEAFDMWYIPKTKYDYAREFEAEYHSDLKAMVEKDRNHPSVILYSIGNEISETAQERGVLLTEKMVQYMHGLDDSRPVTCGINLFLNGLISKGIGIYSEDGESAAEKAADSKGVTAKLSGSALYNMIMEHLPTIKNIVSKANFADKATKDAFAYLDICGYNYGTARYKTDGKKYPDRVIVGSETYISDLYRVWREIEHMPHIIGDFVWTAWDYLGEAGIGSWRYGEGGFAKPYPMLTANCGAISITGQIEPEAFYAKVAYHLDEELKMAIRPVNHTNEKCMKSPWRNTDAVESWSWTGCERMKAEVEVYTDAFKVELFLNGTTKGVAKPKYGIARFALPYEPGILKAVAYDADGKMIKECELKSANESELCIQAEISKADIRKDSELLYIDIRLTDANGVSKILEERELQIEVSGGAILQAFGSDNPCTEDSYIGDTCTTYRGRAQAILRCFAGVTPYFSVKIL